jgi:hypothetical protein
MVGAMEVAQSTRPNQRAEAQVVVVRWPEESEALARLRARGVPRLLLIAQGAPAPPGGECEEDWIRLPADDRDVRARLRAVAARAARHRAVPPTIDEHGVLSFGFQSVTLSPLKAAVAAVLVAHFEETVPREALLSVWPDDDVTGNALRIQILRLRRRLAAVGLEVRAVPGYGYRLERVRS